MPKIYLSPSTQDWNMYVTGSGSEEYNMNLLADALVPYLLCIHVHVVRFWMDIHSQRNPHHGQLLRVY